MKKISVFLLLLLIIPLFGFSNDKESREPVSPATPTLYAIGVPAVILSYFLDETVREWSQETRTDFLDDAAEVINFSHSNNIIYLGAALYLTGIILDDHKLRESSRVAVMSVALNLIQYRLLKYTLGRRRPYHEAGHDAFFEYHDWNGGAFPSGHTSTAFSFWGAYASYYREGVTPYLLYVPATLAGLARIYSDKHWFSDVTGGALLGLTSVHLGIVLNNWLFPRDPVQLVFHSDLKDTVVGVRVGF